MTDISPTDAIPTLEKETEKELSSPTFVKSESEGVSPSDSPSDSKEKLGSSCGIFGANAPVTIREGRPVLDEVIREEYGTWSGPVSVNGESVRTHRSNH